jgi:hypothetical protein
VKEHETDSMPHWGKEQEEHVKVIIGINLNISKDSRVLI